MIKLDVCPPSTWSTMNNVPKAIIETISYRKRPQIKRRKHKENKNILRQEIEIDQIHQGLKGEIIRN